ncbi:unnamed protein product [Oncorhynchus mykiss]|uniref:Ubiquitin-like-conjugating enzyme ATG10 n=1 Tax=Oncorhynchus mykiss TaxID=8022 RepID=A0A060XZF1_ONCMY|nr:unnamed protein product [Oncorhynchus mykiss]
MYSLFHPQLLHWGPAEADLTENRTSKEPVQISTRRGPPLSSSMMMMMMMDQCVVHSSGASLLLQLLHSCPLLQRLNPWYGMRVCLEEVWDSVNPNYYFCRLQNGPWDIITQQVGQSFFVLQLCRTEVFMKPGGTAMMGSQRGQVNYIVSWLSVVGPIVGLDIPFSYCKQVSAAHHTHSLHSPLPLGHRQTEWTSHKQASHLVWTTCDTKFGYSLREAC